MKYSAGMLDLLEALTLPEQPVLFLKLTIQPHICMERLKDAVSQCIAFLPELALRYDKKHNCWRKQKDDTFSMIQEVEDFDFSSWDIERQRCTDAAHCDKADRPEGRMADDMCCRLSCSNLLQVGLHTGHENRCCDGVEGPA